MREPKELDSVCSFLKNEGESYKVLKYWHYKEEEF